MNTISMFAAALTLSLVVTSVRAEIELHVGADTPAVSPTPASGAASSPVTTTPVHHEAVRGNMVGISVCEVVDRSALVQVQMTPVDSAQDLKVLLWVTPRKDIGAGARRNDETDITITAAEHHGEPITMWWRVRGLVPFRAYKVSVMVYETGGKEAVGAFSLGESVFMTPRTVGVQAILERWSAPLEWWERRMQRDMRTRFMRRRIRDEAEYPLGARFDGLELLPTMLLSELGDESGTSVVPLSITLEMGAEGVFLNAYYLEPDPRPPVKVNK